MEILQIMQLNLSFCAGMATGLNVTDYFTEHNEYLQTAPYFMLGLGETIVINLLSHIKYIELVKT